MELRDLEYFLAIAREETITGASRVLHLSQPALTRQLRLLEEELGKQLVVRGSRRITLTGDGMLLRRRAEEILSLTRRTCEELSRDEENLSGDVYLCAGETRGLRYLTAAAKRLRERCPDIRFHLSSGDTADVQEELEKGLIDFGVLFEPIDRSRYNCLPIPYRDTWGILMRRDCPLADKESVCGADLKDVPLIIPRREGGAALAGRLLGLDEASLTIAGTYSLLFNASLMVEDGIGCALGLDGILNLSGDSPLCFRPLLPGQQASMNLVWKRYQLLSRAASAFLEELGREVP